ncbi:MAG: hypothetical protein IPH24_08110 [Crocinitomicaceae bacterium]|nr:hypothetical protein [Crocinitomicaceae bacterium]
MKVQKSSNLNPFGGLNFVMEELDRQKIGALLNQELPAIGKQSQYSWRDLFYSYWSVFIVVVIAQKIFQIILNHHYLLYRIFLFQVLIVF